MGLRSLEITYVFSPVVLSHFIPAAFAAFATLSKFALVGNTFIIALLAIYQTTYIIRLYVKLKMASAEPLCSMQTKW